MLESQHGDFRSSKLNSFKVGLTYVEICFLWKSAKNEGEETISRQPRLCPQITDPAKNGDEQFWKPKIHATSGKAEACNSYLPLQPTYCPSCHQPIYLPPAFFCTIPSFFTHLHPLCLRNRDSLSIWV